MATKSKAPKSKDPKSKASKSNIRKPKARKSKRPTTKGETVTPTLMRPGTGMTIGLHDVVRALKMIDKHKHLKKFATAAEASNAIVAIEATSVNFVKEFIVRYKMHNDPIGKHIVNARSDTDQPLAAPAAGTTEFVLARTIAESTGPASDPFRPCKFSSRG